MELQWSSNAKTELAFLPSHEAHYLVAAWRHEFFHIASVAARVTLALNGMADDASPETVARSHIKAPEEAAINKALENGLLEMPDEISTAFQSVTAAYDKLAFATELYSSFTGGRNKALLSLRSIKRLWQISCKHFLVILGHFETQELAEVSNFNSIAYSTPKIVMMRALLSAGIAGETLESARIDVSQPLLKSRWSLHRRRWDRSNVNLNCHVSSAGHSQSARMRNVSVGGALLEGIDCFARGLPIHIVTECSRKLDGDVVWAAEGKTGVQFRIPLFLSDPILSSYKGNH